VEQGIWGDWKAEAIAPPGSFLCGFTFSEDNSTPLKKIGMDGLKAVFCDSNPI
jgi:hypothetical protein